MPREPLPPDNKGRDSHTLTDAYGDEISIAAIDLFMWKITGSNEADALFGQRRNYGAIEWASRPMPLQAGGVGNLGGDGELERYNVVKLKNRVAGSNCTVDWVRLQFRGGNPAEERG